MNPMKLITMATLAQMTPAVQAGKLPGIDAQIAQGYSQAENMLDETKQAPSQEEYITRIDERVLENGWVKHQFRRFQGGSREDKGRITIGDECYDLQVVLTKSNVHKYSHEEPALLKVEATLTDCLPSPDGTKARYELADTDLDGKWDSRSALTTYNHDLYGESPVAAFDSSQAPSLKQLAEAYLAAPERWPRALESINSTPSEERRGVEDLKLCGEPSAAQAVDFKNIYHANRAFNLTVYQARDGDKEAIHLYLRENDSAHDVNKVVYGTWKSCSDNPDHDLELGRPVLWFSERTNANPFTGVVPYNETRAECQGTIFTIDNYLESGCDPTISKPSDLSNQEISDLRNKALFGIIQSGYQN